MEWIRERVVRLEVNQKYYKEIIDEFRGRIEKLEEQIRNRKKIFRDDD